jgi:hypothetical protein
MRLTFILAFCGLAFATSAEAGPMKFQLLEFGCPGKQCMKALIGDGEITYNSDRAFRSALRKVGRDTPVILNSPGGDLAGGLKLGVAFREAGSSVGVAPGGGCFSACAYAFFGGVKRTVLSGGKLGVHEFIEIGRNPKRKFSAREIKRNKEIADLLNVYAEAMGINPGVISMALKTKHNDIKILSASQMRRMGITTGG